MAHLRFSLPYGDQLVWNTPSTTLLRTAEEKDLGIWFIFTKTGAYFHISVEGYVGCAAGQNAYNWSKTKPTKESHTHRCGGCKQNLRNIVNGHGPVKTWGKNSHYWVPSFRCCQQINVGKKKKDGTRNKRRCKKEGESVDYPFCKQHKTLMVNRVNKYICTEVSKVVCSFLGMGFYQN